MIATTKPPGSAAFAGGTASANQRLQTVLPKGTHVKGAASARPRFHRCPASIKTRFALQNDLLD